MLPTAEEVSTKYDLTGKVALVTGGTAGIGRETVRVLALRHCKVLLGARSLQKGADVRKQILAGLGRTFEDLIEVVHIDLDSLSSIRKFAESFKNRADKRLNILINNAGVYGIEKKQITQDGFESHFGVNHLAPFLLTLLLLPYLKETAIKSGQASRIVNVSSVAHGFAQNFDLDDYNWEKVPFDSMAAYSVSKLFNVYMSNELTQLLTHHLGRSDLVISNSLNPGAVKIWEPNPYMDAIFDSLHIESKSVPEGAATQVFLAVDDSVKEGGFYFDDLVKVPLKGLALDLEKQKKVWALSEKLVGLTFQEAISA